MAAAHASVGTRPRTRTHGWEDRRGRLSVVCADAAALVRHTKPTNAAIVVSAASTSSEGSCHGRGCPSSESTRSGEIPTTSSESCVASTSMAEARGAFAPLAAGNIVMHTARSTAYPLHPPGNVAPEPLVLPAGKLPSRIGIRTVGFQRGSGSLALVDESLAR